MSDFATLWTVSHKPPSFCPRDFPGKSTEAGSYSLLSGIFLTWGSSLAGDFFTTDHQGHLNQLLFSHDSDSEPGLSGRPHFIWAWSPVFYVWDSTGMPNLPSEASICLAMASARTSIGLIILLTFIQCFWVFFTFKFLTRWVVLLWDRDSC